MTDTERERISAICEVAGVTEIDDLSDGFHTFRQLYHQRMMLFATIVKQNKDKAWKSLRHEDGELCFGGGWFIVGIDTPEGSYTYHYEDNYYSLFDCEELERGKHWDGHTEKDVTRLLSLPSAIELLPAVQPTCKPMYADVSDTISRQMAIDALDCINGAEEVLRALPSVQPDHTADIGKKVSISCGQENDLISRQATIDAVGDWIYNPEDLRYHKDVINSIPAVQPEIIRCKNCKYMINTGDDLMCDNAKGWVVATTSDFGCVLAERRIDE